MISGLITLAAIYCAYRVMRASRLLNVTIWLAVTSALVAILLFRLGAPEVAVIELSVGAGLVTVLFVFAFSITGEITFDDLTLIPRPVAWLLAGLGAALVAWFTLPVGPRAISGEGVTFARILWEQRGLDVLVQVVLIFAGVMGLMQLLSDKEAPAAGRRAVGQAHDGTQPALPADPAQVIDEIPLQEARS